MPKGTNLIRFNCKNGKFCLSAANVQVTDLNYLTKFSWQPDVSTKKIYGDGEIQMELVNDKGSTFTLGMTGECKEYEVAMKRIKDIASGTANLKQNSLVPHNIYLECNVANKGEAQKIMKVWILNVTTEAPQETLDQSQEDVNESGVEIVGYCKGVALLQPGTSTEQAVDADGNPLFVTKVTCLPGQEGYANFGSAVPVPREATPVTP